MNLKEFLNKKIKFVKDVEFVWFDNKVFKFKAGQIVNMHDIPKQALDILKRGNYFVFAHMGNDDRE